MLSNASILSKGHEFGPSLRALSGSGWVSINKPETPAATAALASTGTKSRLPPEVVPLPPGCCTECVASYTTGHCVSRIMANERMSDTKLL